MPYDKFRKHFTGSCREKNNNEFKEMDLQDQTTESPPTIPSASPFSSCFPSRDSPYRHSNESSPSDDVMIVNVEMPCQAQISETTHHPLSAMNGNVMLSSGSHNELGQSPDFNIPSDNAVNMANNHAGNAQVPMRPEAEVINNQNVVRPVPPLVRADQLNKQTNNGKPARKWIRPQGNFLE